MMPPVLKQRRIDPARALLLCGLLSILASGCPDPYTFGDRLYSVPWGVEMPVPAGAEIIYDRSSVFLFSRRRDWSLILSVGRVSGSGRRRELGGEGVLRGLLEKGKRLARTLPGRRWIGGNLATIGGARGVQFDFEGPPGKGQGAVYFKPGETVYHRVAVLMFRRRVYRMHFQSLRSARRFSSAIWTNVAGGIRFTGERGITFNSVNLPESDLGEMVEGVLRHAKKE